MKTPGISEEKPSVPEQDDSNSPREFLGTENPRWLRALAALRVRPVPRETLDREAGCSNGPELVANLRRLGLEVPCERRRIIDRDLFPAFPGVYLLTAADRRKLNTWLRRRAAGGQA